MLYCNPMRSTVPTHGKKVDFLEHFLSRKRRAKFAAFARPYGVDIDLRTFTMTSLDPQQIVSQMSQRIHGRFRSLDFKYEVAMCAKLNKKPTPNDLRRFDRVASDAAAYFNDRFPDTVKFIDLTCIYGRHRWFSYFDREREPDRDNEVRAAFNLGARLTVNRFKKLVPFMLRLPVGEFEFERLRRSLFRLFLSDNPKLSETDASMIWYGSMTPSRSRLDELFNRLSDPSDKLAYSGYRDATVQWHNLSEEDRSQIFNDFVKDFYSDDRECDAFWRPILLPLLRSHLNLNIDRSESCTATLPMFV